MEERSEESVQREMGRKKQAEQEEKAVGVKQCVESDEEDEEEEEEEAVGMKKCVERDVEDEAMKVHHWLLYHPERNSVPVVQETGRVTVWTGAENLTHTDTKFPDQPAHIQLSYPLCCPGPQNIKKRYNGHIRYTRSNNPQVAYNVKEILVQAYYKPASIRCTHFCMCL